MSPGLAPRAGDLQLPERGGEHAAVFQPPLEQRHLADEIGNPARLRPFVDFGRLRHLHQPALVHQRDAVGDDHRLFLVMRDDDEGGAELALQLHELELGLAAKFLVEGGQRLVEQQHARALDQRARQRHALTLTAGELADPALAETLQLDEGQHLGHALGALAPADRLLAQAEADIALDREMGKQRVALEHHVDRPAVRRHGADVLAVEQDAAFAQRLETGKQAQQRGLAAAGRTEQREEFAVSDVEGELVERDDVAEALGHLLEAHQRGLSPLLRPARTAVRHEFPSRPRA